MILRMAGWVESCSLQGIDVGGGSKFDGIKVYMGVSNNRGTPKSSILTGFSIIHRPFWGNTIFGNAHII